MSREVMGNAGTDTPPHAVYQDGGHRHETAASSSPGTLQGSTLVGLGLGATLAPRARCDARLFPAALALASAAGSLWRRAASCSDGLRMTVSGGSGWKWLKI
jgi:hypothetical protein